MEEVRRKRSSSSGGGGGSGSSNRRRSVHGGEGYLRRMRRVVPALSSTIVRN